jgi:hypothetical protein
MGQYITAKSITLEIEEYIGLTLGNNFTQLLQGKIEQSKISECIVLYTHERNSNGISNRYISWEDLHKHGILKYNLMEISKLNLR